MGFCAVSAWILCGFCTVSVRKTGCKLLILFEGATAAHFLRDFYSIARFVNGGEGLAHLECRSGVVADHDTEPFLSYYVLFRFCTGSTYLPAELIDTKRFKLKALHFSMVDN